jgi:hypothetical protein
MARVRRVLFIAVALFSAIFFCQSSLFAQTRAEFQLIVPAPDPIQAGETITFQVIAANKGAQTWAKETTLIEAEIYDKNKQYILKADKARPGEDVSSGSTMLVFLTFDVPNNYEGLYFFRVAVTVGGERVAYSDFQSFNVTALPVPPKKPPAVRVGGNAILSYKNTSLDNWQGHAGNISLNLLGSVFEKAVVCNLYTNHNKEKEFDLYNILLNYYSENFDIAIGDVMPDFSILTFANSGVRGVLPVIKSGIFTTTFAGAESIEPVQSSSQTAGVYARYIYGANERISLPLESSAGLSYVASFDDKNSIDAHPLNTAPKSDRVIGGNLQFAGLKHLTLLCDFAHSWFSDDTDSNLPENQDNAWRAGAQGHIGVFSSQFGFQYVGPDFNSLGSPTIVKDRITRKFSGLWRFRQIGNLSLSYTDYRDDLNDDPAKLRTDQRIYSANTALSIQRFPSIAVGWTTNQIEGEDRSLLENYTDMVSGSISYSWSVIGISFTGQSVKFRDKVSETNNRNTLSIGGVSTFLFGERLSLNVGMTDTKIRDLYDYSVNHLDTLSVTGNLKVIPEKFIAAFWGNTTFAKDNDVTSPSDTVNSTANLELTYYLAKRLGWTIGGGVSGLTNRLDESNNSFDTRANTRLSIGF